jgi:glycosyltransferase involved in cell wall biosynthesis
MISKACLIGSYQTKLEQMARLPDVELTVAVPPYWREAGHTTTLERAHTVGYDLVVESIALNGHFHLHFYPRLGRRIRSVAPDIVHIDEEPYNLATFHAMVLARHHGARTLWFTWQNLNRRYPLPFRLIENYCLGRTDYAIAGSEGAAEVWRAKGFTGPLAVIPQFGVSADTFVPRRPRQNQGQRFVVGYAGRLVPEKGLALLLEAMAQLGGEWRLVVAGAGPQRSRLETAARRLAVDTKVSFYGYLPSTRMPAYYRELDVLVVPSLSLPNWVEQFGRVLVEAMASGVPVIGSDCGEIPRVIGDAGLVFPEGDIVALTDHLRRLQHDLSLWNELARKGAERVQASFTQDRVARRTVDLYRQLIAGTE